MLHKPEKRKEYEQKYLEYKANLQRKEEKNRALIEERRKMFDSEVDPKVKAKFKEFTEKLKLKRKSV
jgi:hypothetical protein